MWRSGLANGQSKSGTQAKVFARLSATQANNILLMFGQVDLHISYLCTCVCCAAVRIGVCQLTPPLRHSAHSALPRPRRTAARATQGPPYLRTGSSSLDPPSNHRLHRVPGAPAIATVEAGPDCVRGRGRTAGGGGQLAGRDGDKVCSGKYFNQYLSESTACAVKAEALHFWALKKEGGGPLAPLSPSHPLTHP